MSRRKRHWLRKRDNEITASGIGVLQSTGNQTAGKVACIILVKENMKRCSRPGAIILSEHIHFGYLPGLPHGHDKIIRALAIKKIQRCFRVL